MSKAHRRSVASPLEYYQSSFADRDVAMAKAYATGAYTMKEIGDFFGVHYMTVSRAIRTFEASCRPVGQEGHRGRERRGGRSRLVREG